MFEREGIGRYCISAVYATQRSAIFKEEASPGRSTLGVTPSYYCFVTVMGADVELP
jgi:hypothetical protein